MIIYFIQIHFLNWWERSTKFQKLTLEKEILHCQSIWRVSVNSRKSPQCYKAPRHMCALWCCWSPLHGPLFDVMCATTGISTCSNFEDKLVQHWPTNTYKSRPGFSNLLLSTVRKLFISWLVMRQGQGYDSSTANALHKYGWGWGSKIGREGGKREICLVCTKS